MSRERNFIVIEEALKFRNVNASILKTEKTESAHFQYKMGEDGEAYDFYIDAYDDMIVAKSAISDEVNEIFEDEMIKLANMINTYLHHVTFAVTTDKRFCAKLHINTECIELKKMIVVDAVEKVGDAISLFGPYAEKLNKGEMNVEDAFLFAYTEFIQIMLEEEEEEEIQKCGKIEPDESVMIQKIQQFCDMLNGGSLDILDDILSKDVEYLSLLSDAPPFVGIDEVRNKMTYVRGLDDVTFFNKVGILSENKKDAPDEFPFKKGQSCIIQSMDEEDKYDTVFFFTFNDRMRINGIYLDVIDGYSWEWKN